MRKRICMATMLVLITSLLFSCNRTTTGLATNTYRIGEHTIIIKAGSSINSTANEDSLYFDDGNISIQFKDEILTVNGKKYVVPNKTDSIYIINKLVKINGEKVYPEK